MPTTTVDIYCRTATGGPEALTRLEQQETACRTYCIAHGLSVGMVHYEVASGSTYRDRELLSLMRTRYREGSIRGVVVTTLDRLSRSHVHLIILVQEMEARSVALHCVNEDTHHTPTGMLLKTILGIITEVEREKASDTSLTDPQR